MQALRRRTTQAVNQVRRRQKKHSQYEAFALRKLRIYRNTQRNKIQHRNWKLCQQEIREKWLLGELRSKPEYLEEMKSDVPLSMKPSTHERNLEREMEREKTRLSRDREAMLREREERNSSPEYSIVVSGPIASSSWGGSTANADIPCVCRKGTG